MLYPGVCHVQLSGHRCSTRAPAVGTVSQLGPRELQPILLVGQPKLRVRQLGARDWREKCGARVCIYWSLMLGRYPAWCELVSLGGELATGVTEIVVSTWVPWAGDYPAVVVSHSEFACGRTSTYSR